eukprot:CAMPEP_0194034788 /NCGR_PEP_ID=MMETSP0009_2-20130614/7222_1 /TAXON_ID=210454 /ORGANISM="Grammatophora oceanica, Strain CCMP 410" /LENGTH=201 /DNA_ID=CAMNT_0038675853 /DNA_START=183 /DNA_END=784 /DNA_ORIENTATION=+
MVSKKSKKGKRKVAEHLENAIEVSYDEDASEYTIISTTRPKGKKYAWIDSVVIVDAIQRAGSSYLKQKTNTGIAGALLKQASAIARRKTDVRPSSPPMIRSRSSAPLNRDRSLDSTILALNPEHRDAASWSSRSNIMSLGGDRVRSSSRRGKFFGRSLSRGSSLSSLSSSMQSPGPTSDAKSSKKRNAFFLRKNLIRKSQR